MHPVANSFAFGSESLDSARVSVIFIVSESKIKNISKTNEVNCIRGSGELT